MKVNRVKRHFPYHRFFRPPRPFMTLCLISFFSLLPLVSDVWSQSEKEKEKEIESKMATSDKSQEKSTDEDVIPQPLQKDPEGVTWQTSGLFKIVRPAVFQIKTSIDAHSAKASYGTGFVISTDGLLVTNYHVVASALQGGEDRYQIFIVTKNGSIEAKVIAINVVHDLAIIKVERKFKAALKLASNPVRSGEKIFSVGLPKDLNISMTEGNYNGAIRYGVYEQIHMSSPINSGMSGGPTVNRRGEVVGVNVSVLLNSQNISFSVPAKYIGELLKELDPKIDMKKAANSIIERQLMNVQDSLMEDMKKNPSTMNNLEKWKIAAPSKALKCWSNYKNNFKSSFAKNHQYCSLKSKSYIKEGFYSGYYEIHFAAIRNKKRNPFQFFHLLSYFFNRPELELNYNEEFRELLTKTDCSETTIVNEGKVPFKVNFCVQAYSRYPQIYSASFKAVSLNKDGENLIVKAMLRGFTQENIKEFMAYQLSSIQLGEKGRVE